MIGPLLPKRLLSDGRLGPLSMRGSKVIPGPCPDRDCGSTTSVHALDCAVDMSTPAMNPGPHAAVADKAAGL